jgi:hypothetical protein
MLFGMAGRKSLLTLSDGEDMGQLEFSDVAGERVNW